MNPTNDTHLKSLGYILWIFGFTGSHRFYSGKPLSGTIYFFTLDQHLTDLIPTGDTLFVNRQQFDRIRRGR